jgi:FtsH-binding integral membrane protein
VRRNSVVKVAAWLEIIVGATLVVALNFASQLLFAAAPEGVGSLVGRVAGIALFGLGIACLRSTRPGSGGSATLGLFVYNAGAAIFFAWVALATAFRGVLLWPAVILHTVIACGLLWTSLSGTPRES